MEARALAAEKRAEAAEAERDAMRERAERALTDDEEYAVFAALTSMLNDVHCVQDMMPSHYWETACALYERITARVESRRKAGGA